MRLQTFFAEKSFLMNLLKFCYTAQKDDSAVNTTTPVPDAITPEAHEAQSENNTSSEQVTHVGEPNPEANETEEISNTSSKMTDSTPTTAHSASVFSVHSKPTETPLTKEPVLKNYSDIFQGLGKFPGEPYKLRLKPDSTPAKHRPQKVPLHLQDAFHEEVERLVKIDVLEPVSEPTEWVNSFVVVEKQVNVDTSNAHTPGQSIYKKKQLCTDPKDNDNQQVVLHPASRKQEVLHTASIKYTSMFLEIGRFQWKQLPMETAVAVEIKSEFSTKITLPYFSKDKETLLQTDTSKKGFDAVLIQDNKRVFFTSNALTPSEKNYLYGVHFTPQSKQKLLVKLFIKHLCDPPLRIQRIAIHSWQYNFNTVWTKRKLNMITDIHKSASANTKFESQHALSRVSPQDVEPNIEKEPPIFAVNTLTNFQEGEEKMALKEETANDPELSALHKLISEGWPPKRSSVPDNLKDYWNYRDELTVENGILLKSHKFIVPKNLQSVYIDKIHAGHLGINKSLQKAREYLFWKGYTKDISEAIDKCALCQENAPSNPQRFQYISEVPPHPWHTLGTDLFYHRKQDYLVLVDYFSKFLIVRKLHNSTTGAVVKELSITFSEYGMPFIIRSDKSLLLFTRIQDISPRPTNYTSYQLSTLPSIQWYGRKYGKDLQESD